jgi:hypothetical protein
MALGLGRPAVDAGELRAGRRVIISRIAIGQPNWSEKSLPVSLTRIQVANRPDIDTDKPVSSQHERGDLGYYGYGNYWGGGGLWGAGIYPDMLQGGCRIQARPSKNHRRTTLRRRSTANWKRGFMIIMGVPVIGPDPPRVATARMSLLRRRFYHPVETDIGILIAALGNGLLASLPNCREGATILHGDVLRDAILESLCNPHRIMFLQLIREGVRGRESRYSHQYSANVVRHPHSSRCH